MYGKEITEEYERWLELVKDEQLKDELLEMKDSYEAIIEAFASEQGLRSRRLSDYRYRCM